SITAIASSAFAKIALACSSVTRLSAKYLSTFTLSDDVIPYADNFAYKSSAKVSFVAAFTNGATTINNITHNVTIVNFFFIIDPPFVNLELLYHLIFILAIVFCIFLYLVVFFIVW